MYVYKQKVDINIVSMKQSILSMICQGERQNIICKDIDNLKIATHFPTGVPNKGTILLACKVCKDFHEKTT